VIKTKLLLLGFLLLSGQLFAQTNTAINESNWSNHPQIVEVRNIYKEIEGKMAINEFTINTNEAEYAPGVPTLKILYTDKDKAPRKYYYEAGSDDSSLEYSFYYDTIGKLRFVYIGGGAVNGSVLEHRIYFDETGKRIWEAQKYTDGPGYTFPTVWPDDDLIFDPIKAFGGTIK
jgi:hypothetical protein